MCIRDSRGTAWDVFGYTQERQMERDLITQYEADMKKVLPVVGPETMDAAVALARLPLEIRGFGPVKQESVANAAKRREELLAVIQTPPLRTAAE